MLQRAVSGLEAAPMSSISQVVAQHQRAAQVARATQAPAATDVAVHGATAAAVVTLNGARAPVTYTEHLKRPRKNRVAGLPDGELGAEGLLDREPAAPFSGLPQDTSKVDDGSGQATPADSTALLGSEALKFWDGSTPGRAGAPPYVATA
jgi:hypothetical protein